jgi:hypothetical protein
VAYDWGGHYLDWIVGLIPERIKTVICTRHKRVWHDVTNADQERIQIRFAGGQEAEFIHSDIAALRKPKWYLLGTEGAIIGYWKDVVEYEMDPVVYFEQHDIPATEMPADLTLQEALSFPSKHCRSSADRRADCCSVGALCSGGGNFRNRRQIGRQRRDHGGAGWLRRSNGA